MDSIMIKINDSYNGNINIETKGDSIAFEQYKWSDKYNDWINHEVVIKSENLDKLIKYLQYLQIIKEDL